MEEETENSLSKFPPLRLFKNDILFSLSVPI